VKSIKLYGVREPGLARPREDGGYELLSGNRRKRACELAGVDTMPVIIREMDDDNAAITMVDANLEQREQLLPSEKAWAYRIKLEALNHRGTKSDEPGELSVEILCGQTGESKNQIFRLIRLTYLTPDFQDMVDARKLAFIPAIELSYLSRMEQLLVADLMAKYEVKPSHAQAIRLKKTSQESGLSAQNAESILSEPKKAASTAKGAVIHFSRFFPKNYTLTQMENVIVELLTGWQDEDAAGV